MAGVQFTKEIDDELIAASTKYDIPVNTLKTIAWLESSGDPNAKNPTSSARGLFQFVDDTAKGYDIKDRFDFKEAIDKGAQLAVKNRSTLKKILGREPTSSELYLAHQQGATGAARLLKNPDLNVLKVKGMDKDKVVKNAGNVKMTAGEFANMWINKADALSSAFPATPSYRDLETNPFPVTRRENTAVDTSPRPQMRPQQQEVPAVSNVPQQVPQPLAVEQAVMEASTMPVPPPQPTIQQVPLSFTGGVIPLRLDELNQGTQEVMPRGYEDGTGFVDYFKNLFSTNYQPVPGDMRGSPQGVIGLSNQQLIQANNEMDVDRTAFNPVIPPYVPQPNDMLGYPEGQFGNSISQLVQAGQENRADMSAFNPVVPPLVPESALPTVPAGFAGDQAPMGEGLDLTQMSMNDLQVLSKRNPSMVPIIRQEITRRAGRKMDVAMGDDGRARVPSAYISDERVKPYLQPGMTYTVDGNTVEYNPTVPPVNLYNEEADINREKVINSMPKNSYNTMAEEALIDLSLNGDENATQELVRRNDIANENDVKVEELRKSGKDNIIDPNRPQITSDLSPDVYKEQNELINVPAPAMDNREKVLNDMDSVPAIDNSKEIVPGSTSGTGLSLRKDGQIVGPNGNIIGLPGEQEAKSFGTTMSDLGSKLGPIFKALFGLETQDMTRALGFYLMSRASGASHEGSMRWAGGTVLKQAEARGIRNSARADAAAKAFTAVSGNYTKQAASKIRKELLAGNIVAAQALMDNPENKTARGKLGIDANATGTFYMIPGYTKAMEVFEGTGGNRYTKTTKTVDGKQVETYIPLSSEMMGQLRERNQDDDITSYLAAVRAHVNTMNEDLFKSEYTEDGKVVREKGIFEGRGKAGVTEDIMRISRELGEKGMRNDPRELMTMVSKGAELAKAMGVTSINAETLFEMQFVGGDILFDQDKISKDGELVPSSKIKSFTGDFQRILGNDNKIINATMNTAASNWNPEVTMESIKSSTNYQGLSADEKQKIDSAPSDFMAFALLTAYANKT